MLIDSVPKLTGEACRKEFLVRYRVISLPLTAVGSLLGVLTRCRYVISRCLHYTRLVRSRERLASLLGSFDLSDNILVVDGLKKYFQTSGGVVKAVDEVSFEMREGEVLGVVGESGSGKTTLGNVVMGIYPPTAGKISFRGADLSRSWKFRDKGDKTSVTDGLPEPRVFSQPEANRKADLGGPTQGAQARCSNQEDRRRTA
jgi:ABC-type glutathione transport system ATPase component